MGCGGAGMKFITKAAPTLEEFKALNFGRLSFKKFARKTEKQAAIIQRTQFVVGVKFLALLDVAMLVCSTKNLTPTTNCVL